MLLDRAQRSALLRHPAGWLATGFGTGLSPLAPGTAGSLVALLPWLALRELPLGIHLAVLAVIFGAGVWASAWVVRTLRLADPGIVVIDEFVGQWVALLPLLLAPHAALWILPAVILFRIFDVWKPWPVSWADRRVKGGLGVMLDDVLAGIYAAAVLAAMLWIA